MSKRTIKFEGYCDTKAGWEFDMPAVVVHPILREEPVGNMGGVENIIEDLALNYADGPEPKSDKAMVKHRASIEAELVKARKGSRRYRHWHAEVEIDPTLEAGYKILSQKGF